MTLQGITHKLMSSPTGHRIAYELEDGKNAYGFGLLKTDCLAIQRVFIPASGRFPKLAHEGREWVIVASGELKFYVEDNLRVLKAGDFVCLPPKIEHYFYAKEDSWLIEITMPADPGYPAAPIQVNGLVNLDADDFAHIINSMTQADLISMSEGLKPRVFAIIKETVE